MSPPIRVAILARSPALRLGLAALLTSPEIELVQADSPPSASSGNAGSGPRESAIDVVVAGDAGALDDAARRVARDGNMAIVALTDDPSAVAVMRALAARGWAAASVQTSGAELQAAVIAAARGFAAMPAGRADAFMRAPLAIAPSADVSLTPREHEILELVSRGLPNKAIASALGISDSTVKFHMQSAFEKLGAGSRAEAVSKAARAGLITL